MNDLTLLREAGPQAPPLTPAARSAARAALLAEIEGPAPRRSRRPSRTVAFRIGVEAICSPPYGVGFRRGPRARLRRGWP